MPPAVSIGLPTYNRASLLERAIRSALEQTWADLELVISDNASTDDTEAVCRRWAAQDSRVRYERRERNAGPTDNFNGLFATCTQAEFTLMLSDDDWLDPDYVERCLTELRARPDHAIVAGTPYHWRGEDFVYEGLALQLPQDDPAARVAAYYASVVDNGTFYGLMRGAALRAATPMPNVLGNDWLVVGRVVFLGKLLTLRDTHVHRELGGTSAAVSSIVRSVGGREIESRFPHLFNGGRIYRDIVRGSAVFAPLGMVRSRLLGLRSALGAIDWPSLAWHATEPTARSLGSHRGLGWVWRGYDALTRSMGAGRTPR